MLSIANTLSTLWSGGHIPFNPFDAGPKNGLAQLPSVEEAKPSGLANYLLNTTK